MKQGDCIFCMMVAGKAPYNKVWEDKNHLAFLSIFPNTEGVTVVIPKDHHTSYIFDTPENVMTELVKAARKVAKILDTKLSTNMRTGLIFEGFGVDHLHAKLFPMHGTKNKQWVKIESSVDKFFDKYEGYLSSHDYKRADDKALAKLAKKLRE